MISSFFLVAWIALMDAKLKSFPKAVLVLFSLLSGIYQLAFIFYLPWLFQLLNAVGVGIPILFCRPILRQWRGYATALRIPDFYPLYLFLIYLLFLSVFSVPGWDWDSMIFHLSRPFLYLNEQTVFTTLFSDPRQVVWPMGGDVLYYLFTQHGGTTGTGFISFLAYAGILAALWKERRSVPLVYVAASMPALVYTSNTVKGDPLAVFAFLMMWLSFRDFHEKRKRADLYWTMFALAFGLSCKLTGVFAGAFSVIALLAIELLDRRPWQLTGPKLHWFGFIPFLLLLFILSQAHLYIFNFFEFGHPLGPTAGLLHPMTWLVRLQNFFKYHLELADFVIPFSSVGIPFLDTFLSALYNRTVGAWTGDAPWEWHYFPQEMHASFGPFGFFLVVIGIYRTAFGRARLFERFFALTALGSILFIIFSFPRDENISIVRYFAPGMVASLALLPTIYQSGLLKWKRTIRWTCLGLLLFCSAANYAKPLIAYHPKAIPWYSYAFTNRDLLYKEKHFFDDRIRIFARAVRPDDKILIISKPNVWMYPYYQYADGAGIRLHNFDDGDSRWLIKNMNHYNLIVCEHKKCIPWMNRHPHFKRIWRSASDLPREAAFYRRQGE